MIQINKRSIGMCILLSIITCGIYGIYWMYLLVENTRSIQKNTDSCIGEMLCLIFVPFYSLYWWYTRGEKVRQGFAEHDYNATGGGVVYLVLEFFGLSIVSMAIMQSDFNSLKSETHSEQRSTMKSKIVTTACLFLTAMIWGFAFVAQFYGADAVGDFAMNGLRFPLGAISLLPVMLIFERGRSGKEEKRRTLWASFLGGTVLFIASTLQQVGISVSKSVGISGFLTGLYTIFVPIACYVFFKKKTGFNVVISAFLAVMGIFMLCIKPGVGFSFGLGELLLLVGAFFWTAHVVIVDRLGKNIRSLHFCVGQFAVCSVWSLLTMVIFEMPTIEGIKAAAIPILYAGVLSVGVAYTLQVIGQKRADPTFASIVFSTEAVFSAIGGVIFGIDRISVIGYIGCVFIFAGIVISQLNFKKKKLVVYKTAS